MHGKWVGVVRTPRVLENEGPNREVYRRVRVAQGDGRRAVQRVKAEVDEDVIRERHGSVKKLLATAVGLGLGDHAP